jgi:hypothetical protein
MARYKLSAAKAKSFPQLTTKTTPEIQTLKKQRLEEENNALTLSSARSKILGFHPEDSPRSQNNASNKIITSLQPVKARPQILTLKGRTLNSPVLPHSL